MRKTNINSVLSLVLFFLLLAGFYPFTALVRGSDPEFEPNDTMDQATPILVGYYSDLTLSDGDQDWFKIHIEARTTIHFSLYVISAAEDCQIIMDLYTYGSNLKATQSFYSQSDQYGVLEWTSEVNQDIYLAVREIGLYSNISYNLKAETSSPFEDQFEPNEVKSDAKELYDQDYSGLTITEDNLDWYFIAVPANKTLNFTLTIDSYTYNTYDLYCELYDSHVLIASKDALGSNLDKEINFMWEQKTHGIVYIKIYENQGSNCDIHYSLSIQLQDIATSNPFDLDIPGIPLLWLACVGAFTFALMLVKYRRKT
jgi:hypothetical protein